MMKPRIVVLSAFLSPFRSGAEACAEEVAMCLAGSYEITIVTAKLTRSLPRCSFLVLRSGNEQRTTDNEQQNSVKVMRIGFGIKCDKWLYPFLAPLAVWWLKPTIVHAVLETFAGLALHLCRFVVPQAKQLLTLQTTNRRLLKGRILRSPHGVTAISTALRELAERKGRKDVAVIPNGIPLAVIEEACRREKRVTGRILFVGRLERMKGVDTLLAAFAQLSISNFQFPGLHVKIVGEGSERRSLECLAQELKIADRVTFVGFVPANRVYDAFAQAEIFCGLSRSEALGNVFLEAQAAGCAVVATRVGGIPEVVKDGVRGLLVPPDDVPSARSALGRLLRDTSLRRQLAERGRAHATQYDWSSIAEKYAAAYQKLISLP